MAVDNSGITTLTSSHESGDIFHVGVTFISYVFEDTSMNTAECNFTVTLGHSKWKFFSGFF